MRTGKNEVTVKHQIANIKIQPVDDNNMFAIKNLITLALDSYVLGYNDNIPASVIHSEVRDKNKENYNTPGYYLRLVRLRADLSQAKLAEKLEVKQHHISEMEKNKRTIGKKLARKLGSVLKYDYKKFL